MSGRRVLSIRNDLAHDLAAVREVDLVIVRALVDESLLSNDAA